MILCIDTISAQAGVAVESFFPLDPMRSSEGILETIDEALFLACGKRGPEAAKKLSGILVIKGPGSFTGLRVGISVANQFAHQLGIPILGLRTDEWWASRTEEKDFVYLQSMNPDEVYAVGFGALKKNFTGIMRLDDLGGSALWLGQVSDSHRGKLPASFTEITALSSAQETWAHVSATANLKKGATYELVEPFYGKEAKITPKKKKN